MKIDALQLLCRLISTPSVSREEDATASIVDAALVDAGVSTVRIYNNVLAMQPCYSHEKPTLLLNSHHDTVKPSPSYTRNPFEPVVDGDCLYGLGSNDAGASVAALVSSFVEFYRIELPFNLVLAITAEEEVMGEHGMRSVLPYFDDHGLKIDMALVGEPTGLQPAIGERGLVVLDCVAHGRSGHAARNEGVNAIYKAIADIEILRRFKFPKVSDRLGDISLQVTQIEAGRQHNVVPDECRFVVDVRTTDAYTNEQTVALLQAAIGSDVTPRSTRVWASVISSGHPMVRTAVDMGRVPFVSPTTSDMALMHHIPSLKIGPGQSSRSHTADEFVLISELEEALRFYHQYIINLTKYFEYEIVE